MLTAWLTFILGITFTAGPVNITTATVAARYSWRKILPFITGVNSVNLIYCLVAAFWMGKVYNSYVFILPYFRVFGSFFILYLAYKIFRSASAKQDFDPKIPNFRDGFVLNSLNIKTLLMFGVTFTQFASPHKPWLHEIFFLGGGTLLFCVLSQLFWAFIGSVAGSLWKKYTRAISYVCSLLLVGVAVWILVGLL